MLRVPPPSRRVTTAAGAEEKFTEDDNNFDEEDVDDDESDDDDSPADELNPPSITIPIVDHHFVCSDPFSIVFDINQDEVLAYWGKTQGETIDAKVRFRFLSLAYFDLLLP